MYLLITSKFKMKLKSCRTILFISLFSVSSFAQQLDESFIRSLPDDIASDILKENSKKNNLEAIQYRRPSTFIEKPEPTSSRYGAKVFSMMQSSLMPINEPNFDSSYVLDYGDQLELQLTGQKSSTDNLVIKRDGSVNIEDLGKIFLSGLSLGEAADLIKSKINKSFIGIEAYLTLVNVRDVQVIMSGNVYNPGPFTLSGNSNIFNALSVSGGPSELGSFRSINLIRDNKIIESIDLYQIFIFGKSSLKMRLRSGDIIFINPVKNVVEITGSIKRPGQYELLDNENLDQLIKFANGLDKFADLQNIKLDRILDGEIKTIPIVNISQFKNITANDGDSIFIRSHSFRSVEIRGAILNPSTYLMLEGENIHDVIKKAGGYTKNAYPFGGVYENKDALLVKEKANKELYLSFLNNLISMGSQTDNEGDLSPLIALTNDLRNAQSSGRVITDFVNTNDPEPTLVKDGDVIVIPEILNQVYLYGEISSQGSARYKEGEDFLYYLNAKGSLSASADKKNIFVLQPNGKTEKININRNIFMNQSKEVKIYAGSVIYIPRKLNAEYSQRQRAQAYAAILANMGVSLASISVLKD